jgi:site-specific recombinase XerD
MVLAETLRSTGAGDEIRTHDSLLGKQINGLKLLNKLPVSTIAELSNLSRSYISQVKHGKCPPSQKLINALAEQRQAVNAEKDYYSLFMQSREAMGVSTKTLQFYRERLIGFLCQVEYPKATRQDIQRYLNSIPANHYGLATRHATFRAIKTLYRWLNSEFGIRNPMHGIAAPILGKPILPSLEKEQVLHLIGEARTLRDKAIIAFFVESGLRLSELANIKPADIDWANHKVRIMGKGRKEAYAPFGGLTEQYLKAWLAEYQPNGNIWGMSKSGIIVMLQRLEASTGIKCNPHTFRRTFACLLRKAGVDSMTIKDLGRWESLEMVQRYTRSITFEDSMKHYKAPLG